MDFRVWLGIEFPDPAWRHVAHVLFGDVPLIAGIVLFFPWLFSGRPSPARRLTLIWMGYYLLMVVVIFHNELRYRNVFFPFLFATTAGGLSVLFTGRRRFATYAGVVVGLVVALVTLEPYWGAAWGRMRASFALGSAHALVERGEIGQALKKVERASRLAPRSPRPYLRYGHWLVHGGHLDEAIDAYQKAQVIAPAGFVPRAVLPQLMREAGREDEEVTEAIRSADRLSWNADPWLVLEVAWRQLPPPTTNVIDVGWGDYGAVRDFLHPRGDTRAERRESRSPFLRKSQAGVVPPGVHRFSRKVSWIRLIPSYRAAAHRVAIEMGSPYPSTLKAPRVDVTVNGGRTESFTLGREIQSYELDADAEPGAPIVIRIDSPTWSRAGERASQGVRVDRVTVSPVDPMWRQDSTFPRIMRAMFGLPVSTSSGSSRIVDGTKEGQKGFRVLDGR